MAAAGSAATSNLPFQPSWLDHLMTAVRHLPMPYWLTYLLLGAAESCVIQGLIWLSEPEWRFTLRAESVIFPLWTWGVLALMTALNREGTVALYRFHPLLDADDAEMEKLQFQFTHMPARLVWLTSPIWLGVFALIVATSPSFQQHRHNLVLFPALVVIGAFTFLVGGGIYIHTIHQLRLVNQIYKRMKKINMFHLIPVYAFSGLTAQTAIGFIALVAVTQLLYPYSWVDPNVIGLFLGQILLAFAAFWLPLRHGHQRLVSGKQHLQADAAQRLETLLQQLHDAVDQGNVATVDGLNKVLSALAAERDLLAKIPTWPWQPGTFRTVGTVLVVPIALFLIQAILRRWLGL